MLTIEEARRALEAFVAAQPRNFWSADAHLRGIAAVHDAPASAAGLAAERERFGAISALEIGPACALTDHALFTPRLASSDAYGRRLEGLEHHPAHDVIGAHVYGSGMLAALGRPGGNFRSAVLFFLSSLNGEAGHHCAVVCTAGAIKTLQALGSPQLREAYLPRFLSTNYSEVAHAAQFLTEVQGGSDVGANLLRAAPVAPEGTWQLWGEKWFCSNPTADLLFVTGRPPGAPEGGAGLGLFAVPRRLADGSLNAYRLRRLKDKIGTRALATAEIEFEGATAWQLGQLSEGLKNTMRYLIATSRLYNAVGTAAAARRAWYVADAYARHRSAFGRTIIEYPLVQETLADLRADSAAAMSGSLYLAATLDALERGQANRSTGEFWRTAVNLTKLQAAATAHDAVRMSIEVLGGNGAIEDFSPLPRLLRDTTVFENWEGTPNTLLVQLLRDLQRQGTRVAFFSHLTEQVAGHVTLTARLEEVKDSVEACLAGPQESASLGLRRLAPRMAHLQWGAALFRHGGETPLLGHYLDRHFSERHANIEASYTARLAELNTRRRGHDDT